MHRVGDGLFWAILRTWAAEQGGGTGSTEQFEALAERVSGQDLAGFFEAWLFTSPRLLAYAAAMAACFHLFVTGYEERTLARRFGPAYREYRRAVPRWIPRKPQVPQAAR